MNPNHFLEHVIRPTLTYLAAGDMTWLASASAERLLLGTALAESRLAWLVQLNSGPARGVFQMEPATAHWLYDDYLPNQRPELHKRVADLRSRVLPMEQELVCNLAFATAMARARYLPVPQALPDADDDQALGAYWKAAYNTAAGAGTVQHFVDSLESAIA